jgi:quercetin dioxygenase-like cupin family protein
VQTTRSSIATQKGPADWFTGDVYIDAIAAPAGTSTFAAASVHFTPGARTAWHTHPHGQTVFVTEGVGLCQRGVYIATQQNDENGSPVTWGEHVTDEQYKGVAR